MNEQKNFFSNLFIGHGRAFIISGRKFFFLDCAREFKGKDIKTIINLRFYFTDKQNNYVTYMNLRYQLLVRWRQLLIRWKKWKWLKQTQKRFQAKFSFCSFLYVQLPNFLRKKIRTPQCTIKMKDSVLNKTKKCYMMLLIIHKVLMMLWEIIRQKKFFIGSSLTPPPPCSYLCVSSLHQ